jgi:hypothetical protein
MRQFVLDYLAIECGKARQIVACRRETDEADLLITLADGKRIAVCVINRAIRLPEIKERYERNTLRGIHTLYIIDGRMLPPDNAAVEPPYWMAALHTLMHGRIYAYWCEGRDVSIRPLHMEWKWGGSPRIVEYGDEISMNTLAANRIDSATKYIDGAYLSANFGEGAFWKKRQPADDRQYSYSWRNWSYGEPKQRSTDEEQSEWSSWEEFNNSYGSVGGEDWEWTGEEFRQRTSRTRDSRREKATHNKHYAVLGVSATASLDEVKRAYRRKAREYHPDLHPNEKEKYTAKMADINAAFDAIVRKGK